LVEFEFLSISQYKFKTRPWLEGLYPRSCRSPVRVSPTGFFFLGGVIHRVFTFQEFGFAVDSNLPTIQDLDLHFNEHFECHLLGNGLYMPGPSLLMSLGKILEADLGSKTAAH